MLGFIVAILIWIAICVLAIIAAYYVAKIWLVISAISLAFSRLALSLLVATGIGFGFKLAVFDSGFLNYLLRVAIVYVFIWLASYIPRIEPAIGTLCTFLVSIVAVMFTIMFAFMFVESLLQNILGIDSSLTNSWWCYLLQGVAVTIAMAINWLNDVENMKEKAGGNSFLSKPIFIRIGRVIASLIYGVVFYMIFTLAFQLRLPLWAEYLLLIGCAAAAYVADLFLFDRATPKRNVPKIPQ